MRLMMVMLSMLVLSACSGYRSSSDGMLGFEPSTASGGSYQRDGFYDGGSVDLDVTSPRPGD